VCVSRVNSLAQLHERLWSGRRTGPRSRHWSRGSRRSLCNVRRCVRTHAGALGRGHTCARRCARGASEGTYALRVRVRVHAPRGAGGRVACFDRV
jgi:hypothetical protein